MFASMQMFYRNINKPGVISYHWQPWPTGWGDTLKTERSLAGSPLLGVSVCFTVCCVWFTNSQLGWMQRPNFPQGIKRVFIISYCILDNPVKGGERAKYWNIPSMWAAIRYMDWQLFPWPLFCHIDVADKKNYCEWETGRHRGICKVMRQQV